MAERSGVILVELLGALMILIVLLTCFFVLVPASNGIFNGLLNWYNNWTPPVPFNTYGNEDVPTLLSNLFAEVVLSLVLCISGVLLYMLLLPWLKNRGDNWQPPVQ